MSILKYLVKQSNPTQDSSTAISLPVNARVSQSSIEEAECEDAHDMEFVHSSSARMYVIKPPQISKVVSGHALCVLQQHLVVLLDGLQLEVPSLN